MSALQKEAALNRIRIERIAEMRFDRKRSWMCHKKRRMEVTHN